MKIFSAAFYVILLALLTFQGVVTKEPIELDTCVAFNVYFDEDCTGVPLRTQVYSTASQSGGECYHDVSTARFSVRDYYKYCNEETENFYEKLFIGTPDCTKSWWNFWCGSEATGADLEFTPGKCIGGYSLRECTSF